MNTVRSIAVNVRIQNSETPLIVAFGARGVDTAVSDASCPEIPLDAVERKRMNDRVKIVCSNCRKPFSERAPRLKNGYQVQCPNCMRLITFDTSSEDPNIRRPLKAARDFRIAAETALVMARMAAQEPKRDSGY
jgi:hypothetical protein